MADYGFRPVTRDDLPMLHAWLSEPHVRETWGDPDAEIALIAGDLDGQTDCRAAVVTGDGVPFAYIQDWDARNGLVPHYFDQPSGARSVDTMLGAPEWLGKGHAKSYVRRYAERLRAAGAPAVLTDPRLTNPRGIAMYRAAGFVDGPIRIAEDGQEVVCMEFRGEAPKKVETT